MSAGGYCETVHGAMGEEKKTGKRKQNVWHYKPFSSSRGRRGLEGGMICAHHYPSLFQLLCSPSPAGCFTMCTS